MDGALTCSRCGTPLTREMAARREAVSVRGRPYCARCASAPSVSVVVEEVGTHTPIAQRDTVAAASAFVEAEVSRPTEPKGRPGRTPPRASAGTPPRKPAGAAGRDTGRRRTSTAVVARSSAGPRRKGAGMAVGIGVAVVALVAAAFGIAHMTGDGPQRARTERAPEPVDVTALVAEANRAHERGCTLFEARQYPEALPHFEKARDLLQQAKTANPALAAGLDEQLSTVMRNLVNCERQIRVH